MTNNKGDRRRQKGDKAGRVTNKKGRKRRQKGDKPDTVNKKKGDKTGDKEREDGDKADRSFHLSTALIGLNFILLVLHRHHSLHQLRLHSLLRLHVHHG